MNTRIKNIKLQITTGIMAIIVLIIAANLIGFALFSKFKVQRMVLERAMNQVAATARYAEHILQTSPDYLADLQKLVDKEAAQDAVAYAVIIDKNITAIAHSDHIKLGKVYNDDYTIEGASKGVIKTSRFYADVQKYWTYDIMYPLYKGRCYFRRTRHWSSGARNPRDFCKCNKSSSYHRHRSSYNRFSLYTFAHPFDYEANRTNIKHSQGHFRR